MSDARGADGVQQLRGIATSKTAHHDHNMRGCGKVLSERVTEHRRPRGVVCAVEYDEWLTRDDLEATWDSRTRERLSDNLFAERCAKECLCRREGDGRVETLV